jgi:alkyl sulfatase BDS1-like metallo-beta-lactamase superfamily hydrolase
LGGISVIDPLISAAGAAAARGLYGEQRGERPVTGVIDGHSHVEHLGGA